MEMPQQKIKAALHTLLGRKGVFSSFDREVDRVSRRLGPGGLWAIANCNDYRYEKFVDSFSQGDKYGRDEVKPDKNAVWIPEKELLIVRGQEVFADKGHYLVFGLPKNTNIETENLEEGLKHATDLGAVLGVDHPFFKGNLGGYLLEHPELLKYFHTWEVYNASAGAFSFGKANQKSKQVYENQIRPNYNIGAFAGDDSHTCTYMAKNFTPINPISTSSSEMLNQTLQASLRYARNTKLQKNPLIVDAGIHAYHMLKDECLAKLGIGEWFADPGEYKEPRGFV